MDSVPTPVTSHGKEESLGGRSLVRCDECLASSGSVRRRHSRAVAPLYGSRIGYAPVDPAEATAPGQYDLATLSELVGSLRSEHFK